MRGDRGRGGEDNEAYEAQLAEVLSRWEAERATTADLQGRAAAAAAAGLHGKVRASAEAAATAAQAELEAARAELDMERRGRVEVEREVQALRLQVSMSLLALRCTCLGGCFLPCGAVQCMDLDWFVVVSREGNGRPVTLPVCSAYCCTRLQGEKVRFFCEPRPDTLVGRDGRHSG